MTPSSKITGRVVEKETGRATFRSEIAALKRQVQELERLLAG